MNSFKPLNTAKYAKTDHLVTPDIAYWKKLSVPTLVKEFGAIDYIDFSAIEPHYFAVTCSVRVQIYNPITKLVIKNLSRFQETAYGGTFRQDGRILAAGDEQGSVKLFDISSKNILRVFKGHTSAVHRVKFTSDLFRLASFSDDNTMKLWDITSENVLQTFAKHTDYIRAGATNPTSPNILVSGGYDGKINMYDTRLKQVITTMDHNRPVESLLFLPTGGILLSAGGTELRVWDIFGGCRLMAKLSQHHKTITCLHLGSNGKRILSGSLDRHVKIYDVENYQTVHSMDFPDSIISLGLSPNDQTIAAGMVDGLISIQNMESSQKGDATTTRKIINSSILNNNLGIRIDHNIVEEKSKKQETYNNLLRNFKYVKSLESALDPTVKGNRPNKTVSIIQELIRRKGLHRCVQALSSELLIRLIKFITRHIGEYRFMRVLIDAATILLDAYEERFHELNTEIVQQFIQLSDVIKKEISLSYELLEFQGAFEMLLAATKSKESNDEIIGFIKNYNNMILEQSDAAKHSLILDV